MIDELVQTYRAIVADLTAPEGPFPVELATVRGRPTRVFANTPESFYNVLAAGAAAHSGKVMIEYLDRRWTYSEVFETAAALGAALREVHGIAPGDRVGIAMRNLPEWFIAFLAIIRIGAVATLINSRGPGPEMAAASDKVRCRVVFADEKCAERLAGSSLGAEVLTLDDLAALARRGGADRTPVRVDRDDPVAIVFTSGTTGQAKAATLTHRNLASMAVTIRYVSTVGLHLAAHRTGVAFETLAKATPAPSLLAIMPMFHVSGLANFIMADINGGLITIMRRWDAAEAIRLIEKNGITGLAGPSMIMTELLDQPDAAERLKSITNASVGGQATPPMVAKRIRETLPRASQAAGWGMTELSGAGSSASGPVFHAFPGSVGFLTPLVEGRIVDADGVERPAYEPGELEIRGAMVMAGYFDDPEANAHSFRDAWFRTGDIGYFDGNGLLYLVDRAKDMVISAGENIYSAEIEHVLGAHDDVVEVAMFGVPDERLGERAVVALNLREGSRLDETAVKAIAGQQLADYKVPREVLFDVGPLPRNGIGKVDKVALRKLYMERRNADA